MNIYRLVYFSLTILLLQACGSTVLIKHEATNSVSGGKKAINEINNFYDYVFYTQNKLAASLIARYPSCNFGDSIVVRTSFVEIDKQKNVDSLCLSDTELKEWQAGRIPGKRIDLNPLERSAFKLPMEILDAFAKYLDTMSLYTVEATTPISNTLKGVTDELVAVQGKAKFLPDSINSKIAQVASVSELIGYLEKLINNTNDAKEIKKIILLEGEKQERNLLDLAEEADALYTTYVASMSSTLTTTLGDYYNRNKNSKEFDTLEERQTFLLELFKQKQLDKRIQTSSSPGSQAIRLFVSAHQKLRDAINGNYSKEQKALILKENMMELKSSLQHVANLAKFAMTFL